MELLEICEYRSTSKVNMTNDRIRVVLTMTLNEWHIFKKQHEIDFNSNIQYSSKET